MTRAAVGGLETDALKLLAPVEGGEGGGKACLGGQSVDLDNANEYVRSPPSTEKYP